MPFPPPRAGPGRDRRRVRAPPRCAGREVRTTPRRASASGPRAAGLRPWAAVRRRPVDAALTSTVGHDGPAPPEATAKTFAAGAVRVKRARATDGAVGARRRPTGSLLLGDAAGVITASSRPHHPASSLGPARVRSGAARKRLVAQAGLNTATWKSPPGRDSIWAVTRWPIFTSPGSAPTRRPGSRNPLARRAHQGDGVGQLSR